MEPESSSPYPQVTAIRPYSEPTPSSPHDLLQCVYIYIKTKCFSNIQGYWILAHGSPFFRWLKDRLLEYSLISNYNVTLYENPSNCTKCYSERTRWRTGVFTPHICLPYEVQTVRWKRGYLVTLSVRNRGTSHPCGHIQQLYPKSTGAVQNTDTTSVNINL